MGFHTIYDDIGINVGYTREEVEARVKEALDQDFEKRYVLFLKSSVQHSNTARNLWYARAKICSMTSASEYIKNHPNSRRSFTEIRFLLGRAEALCYRKAADFERLGQYYSQVEKGKKQEDSLKEKYKALASDPEFLKPAGSL